MTASFHIRDENMYVTAGVMAGQYSLYAEFPYLQMPYTPWAYELLFRITGTTHYLLTARLFSLALFLVSALIVYLISLRLTGAKDLAILLTLVFVLNVHIMTTMSFAWGAALGIALSLLSLHAFLGSTCAPGSLLRMVWSGVLLGLAVGTKAYYLSAVPPMILAAALHPLKSRSGTPAASSVVLPVLTGVLLGLSPAFYAWWAHGDVFVFDNLVFHQINWMWRADTGFTRGMGLVSKLQFVKEQCADPSNVAILTAMLFLLAWGRVPGRIGKEDLKSLLRPEIRLTSALLVATIAGAMLPTPLFAHYFAMPVPFGVALLAALCGRAIAGGAQETSRIVLRIAAVTCVAFSGTRLLHSLPALLHRDRWFPLMVHDTGMKIRSRVMAEGAPGKVATLSPIYAIEGGLPIYRELASGVFMYRIGDYLSPEQRRRFVGTSPQTIGTLLETDPPRALVTGAAEFDGDLEKPFVTFAERFDYEKLDVNGVRLYLRRGDKQARGREQKRQGFEDGIEAAASPHNR